jgi:hypothetical protein
MSPQRGEHRWSPKAWSLSARFALGLAVLVDSGLASSLSSEAEAEVLLEESFCAVDSDTGAARQGCAQLQSEMKRVVAPSQTSPTDEVAANPSGIGAVSSAKDTGVPVPKRQPGQATPNSSALAGVGKATHRARRRRTSVLASAYTWTSIATLVLVPLSAAIAFAYFRSRRNGSDANMDAGEPAVLDTMTYQISGLVSWEVFTGYPCTVWDNDTLWYMMRRLVGVALLVAVVEFMIVPDPIGMDPTLFDSVGTMLNVFVGLLLSFFLTSNVNRWIQIVNGFLNLFNSTRNLQLVMHAFGAKRENSDRVLRYCVLSGHFVTRDLQQCVMPKAQREPAAAKMWEDLEQSETTYSKLLPEEREQLQGVEDPSGMCWTWVMSMLGRMSQDGELPPFGAGTFGMVLTNACNAKKGMDGLRDCIKVQMPFVYVHTVATLVQLNNLLAAVSLGLTIGATLGGTCARFNKTLKIYEEPMTHEQRPIMEDIQEVLVQLFRCFVAPVLYQAFFEIGVSIASPFYSEDGTIPAERLLARLERDLLDSSEKADSPPGWVAPCMKK